MRSKLPLCLLLHVCHSATVKAFPASRTLAFDPNLRDRADTQFVTIYGLYDNSLHTPSLDTSKQTLAPITEAFMAMTRALATPTVTATESGSRSVMHSATPTPLHKATPPSLGPGLVVRPTPVQSTSSTPSSTPEDTPDALLRAARIRTHRLVVFGSVLAGIALLSLLLFFIFDPRMMRKFCGKKVDNNLPSSSRKEYPHPTPVWAVSPISFSDSIFMDGITEKAFFAKRKPVNAVIEIIPKHPTSKFSVCSSEYPPTVSVASEPELPAQSETCPVRPPRPPTVDSPALTESVYLAYAEQPYIIVAPQPFTDIDLGLDSPPATPTGPKILTPREFFNMHIPHPAPTCDDSNMNATLLRTRSNTIPECYDTRHSRTHSAPLFVESTKFMNEETSDSPEPINDQRMSKHRRSRSASGWAYPNRPLRKNSISNLNRFFFSNGR